MNTMTNDYKKKIAEYRKQQAIEAIQPELQAGWTLRIVGGEGMLVQPLLPGAKGNTVIFLSPFQVQVAQEFLAKK